MEPELFLTEDGSHTLSSERFKQYYHSYHGALQESEYVFMKFGWDALPDKESPVHVFEMGLGTGLNALLAFDRAVHENRKLFYFTVEAFPPPDEILAALNFPEVMGKPELRQILEAIHADTWESWANPIENIRFFKTRKRLEEVSIPARHFDLVFFDAFAPASQPELWTIGIFEKMREALKPGGILTTYCAKGEVRRNMIAAGLEVEKLPGPPGKREMLRAKRPF